MTTGNDEKLQLDISALKEKLNLVLSNPQTRVVYPVSNDYDRNFNSKFSSIASWVGTGVPTKKRIFSRVERSFAFAKHVIFDNLYDCHPNQQRIQRKNNYTLHRNFPICPPYYSQSYYTECGKHSSFWSSAHLKSMITDKWFAHGISMMVMMNIKTRKPMKVLPTVKELIDDHWNNLFPKTLKTKYYNLKNALINDMKMLNEFKQNVNKNILYSYPIQLRYGDEDVNHHLNIATYLKYIYEGLLMYDKDIRRNKKVICCMSNVYWKEIRMKYWNHCYVNVWDVKQKEVDGKCIKLYIGTIDIDKRYCKRENDEIKFERNNNKHEWVHYHGFVAGVIECVKIQSKL